MAYRLELKRVGFSDGKFAIEIAHLTQKPDSTSKEYIRRLNFVRGDSAAVLVHDTEKDEIILAKQFRYPVMANERSDSDGFILEVPAGNIEEGEAPEHSGRREVEEEVGYAVSSLEFIISYFPSPGACSERIDLFYAAVTGAPQAAGVGGAEEDEDIEIVRVKTADFIAMASDGRILDGKTVMAAWWLDHKRRSA